MGRINLALRSRSPVFLTFCAGRNRCGGRARVTMMIWLYFTKKFGAMALARR